MELSCLPSNSNILLIDRSNSHQVFISISWWFSHLQQHTSNQSFPTTAGTSYSCLELMASQNISLVNNHSITNFEIPLHAFPFGDLAKTVGLWSNGPVVKVLDSQSRDPMFKITGWLQGQLSLSSF